MCRSDIRFTATSLLVPSLPPAATTPPAPTAPPPETTSARWPATRSRPPSTPSPSRLARPLNVGGPPCVAPSVATDDDGDGIPNDATYLFTAPPCRYSGVRGSTLDIVGQLRVQDPSHDRFGYAGTLTTLRHTLIPDDERRPRLHRHPERVPRARPARPPASSSRPTSRSSAPSPASPTAPSRSCGPSTSPRRRSSRSTSRSPTGPWRSRAR